MHCHECGLEVEADSLCTFCGHAVSYPKGSPGCSECMRRSAEAAVAAATAADGAQKPPGEEASASTAAAGEAETAAGAGPEAEPEVEHKVGPEVAEEPEAEVVPEAAAVGGAVGGAEAGVDEDVPVPEGNRASVWVVLGVLVLIISCLLFLRAYDPRHKVVALRLHSCRLVGADLLRDLAKGFLMREGVEQEKIIVDESRRRLGELRVSAFVPKDSAEVTFNIFLHEDSSAAVSNTLRDGECDMAVLWRKLSSDENARMKEGDRGDMLTEGSEWVLGQDAFVVVVNGKNPITSLEKEDLKDILTAGIKRWEQLPRKAGGEMSGPVKVYVPSERTEIYKDFCTALGIEGVSREGEVKFLDNYADVSDYVYQEQNAIGFTNLPNVKSAKHIEIMDAGGARRAAYGGDSYIEFSQPIYLYKSAKAGEYAERFKSFILSAEGRGIVHDAKLDPRTPQESARTSEEPPPFYKKLTEKAVQVKQFSCQFDWGKSEVKKKCLDAVGGLLVSLKNPNNKGWKRVMVFGFADSTGEEDPNRNLSRRRAQVVAAGMAGQAEVGEVEGFGSSLPVARNDTEEGRERNRRVEIWLRP